MGGPARRGRGGSTVVYAGVPGSRSLMSFPIPRASCERSGISGENERAGTRERLRIGLDADAIPVAIRRELRRLDAEGDHGSPPPDFPSPSAGAAASAAWRRISVPYTDSHSSREPTAATARTPCMRSPPEVRSIAF